MRAESCWEIGGQQRPSKVHSHTTNFATPKVPATIASHKHSNQPLVLSQQQWCAGARRTTTQTDTITQTHPTCCVTGQTRALCSNISLACQPCSLTLARSHALTLSCLSSHSCRVPLCRVPPCNTSLRLLCAHQHSLPLSRTCLLWVLEACARDAGLCRTP